MAFNLSARSLGNLKGVHPDLVAIVKRAIQLTKIDFVVICGLRTVEQQKVLVATGKSKTMKSRHITGHAVDLAPIVDGKVSWEAHCFLPMAAAMKEAATELGIPVEWGGDWKTFVDMPHFQLPQATYR